MGLFKKLFGGDDACSKDSDSKGVQDENAAAKDAKESEPVFYADGEDEAKSIRAGAKKLSLLLARAVLGAPPHRPRA